MSTLTPVRPAAPQEPTATTRPRRRSRGAAWTLAGLLVVLAAQVVLELRAPEVGTAFEDEGLYVYMGHRMISHLLHGTFIGEFPGSYFSGAPGLYPVLAALGDHVDGLNGARDVSTVFGLGATVGVHGLARQLYGRLAGLIAATTFILCGSVIYISHFATYDSMAMCFIALAAWLTVASVHRDRFAWFPAVSVLLVVAFYAKYAAAAYVPVVAALAVVAAPRTDRLAVARRSVAMVFTGFALGFFILGRWGESLIHGIVETTLTRHSLYPASRTVLLDDVKNWVGLWLVLAVLAVAVTWRTRIVTAVLLLGAVIGPLDQIRIHESTSLNKHVAFGLVFACPLIGALFAAGLHRRWLRWATVPVLTFTVAVFALSGQVNARVFLTQWPSDAQLVPALTELAASAPPGKMILGDSSSPERYALEGLLAPAQWRDTYSFHYQNKTGLPAYRAAINHAAFGEIYNFKSGSAFDPAIFADLDSGKTPYRLVGTIERVRQRRNYGYWYLFIPKTETLPAGWASTPGVVLPSKYSIWGNPAVTYPAQPLITNPNLSPAAGQSPAPVPSPSAVVAPTTPTSAPTPSSLLPLVSAQPVVH